MKDAKKSVSRFVKAYQDKLTESRDGKLSKEDGIILLRQLLNQELVKNSAGWKFLLDTINTLKSDEPMPKGHIEAYNWDRDPWTDLTCSTDFYSSASLRGNTFIDDLERRSKGMLGTFGYIRNKSISNLDFRTSEGRSVRARLAATKTIDLYGETKSILFVDAVEGSLNIEPAIIKLAIEDYARICQFDAILYHRFPLNKVPLRFIN